jgi:cell division topological specificity factor
MSLLDRLLGRPAPLTGGSGAVAKERLKLVLEYDRAQLSPAELELIRDDIIASISRHVDVSREDVQVTLEPGGRLVAEIPIGGRGGRQAGDSADRARHGGPG